MLDYIVVEFVPIRKSGEFGTGIPGQWMKEQTIKVQTYHVEAKDEATCETGVDQRRYFEVRIHVGTRRRIDNSTIGTR